MWNDHRLRPEFGTWEFILVLLVLFILFGHRLPSIMRFLGRGPGPPMAG